MKLLCAECKQPIDDEKEGTMTINNNVIRHLRCYEKVLELRREAFKIIRSLPLQSSHNQF